jgi:hypothetical protein
VQAALRRRKTAPSRLLRDILPPGNSPDIGLGIAVLVTG